MICNKCNKTFTASGIHNHAKSCKQCPVCNVYFAKPTVTCSYSCSNTYFRSKDNHPNWKESSYRSTCFLNHKKECVICKESLIVEVHHLDENKNNNSPNNLIPLCPTHHQYWHSKFKYLVEKEINEYIRVWENSNPAPLEGADT